MPRLGQVKLGGNYAKATGAGKEANFYFTGLTLFPLIEEKRLVSMYHQLNDENKDKIFEVIEFFIYKQEEEKIEEKKEKKRRK